MYDFTVFNPRLYKLTIGGSIGPVVHLLFKKPCSDNKDSFFWVTMSQQLLKTSTVPLRNSRPVDNRFLPIPLSGQLGSSSDSFVPHDGKVGGTGKVLSDGNGGVQVEDDVPPSTCRELKFSIKQGTWRRMSEERVEVSEVTTVQTTGSLTGYEDRLSRFLQDLQRRVLRRPVGLLRPGVNHVEPGNGLILLVASIHPGHFDQLPGCVGGEQTPSLVSLDQGVPGTGPQWIYVNAGT